jgi:hypothetical protein
LDLQLPSVRHTRKQANVRARVFRVNSTFAPLSPRGNARQDGAARIAPNPRRGDFVLALLLPARRHDNCTCRIV